MERWHREQHLMLRRWKLEMEQHGYDWRNPPTDPNACHCARGIGSFRKKNAPAVYNGCNCEWCNPEHFKNRANQKRAAIEDQLA